MVAAAAARIAAFLVCMFAVPAGHASAESVALINVNQLAPYFRLINAGAIAAARAAGVELVVFNANDVAQAQRNAIETYVVNGVDAIAILPIDPPAMQADVAWAAVQGVPVVAIGMPIPGGDGAALIGPDNGRVAREIVARLIENARVRADRPLTVAVVGVAGDVHQERRRAGLTVALSTAATGVEIIEVSNEVSSANQVRDIVETLMSSQSGIDAICATGPTALAGAIAALDAARVRGQIALYGWDLSAAVVQAIDAGTVTAVVQQDGHGVGQVAIETAVRLIREQPVMPVVDVPVIIVTKDNVDDFRGAFE